MADVNLDSPRAKALYHQIDEITGRIVSLESATTALRESRERLVRELFDATGISAQIREEAATPTADHA